jgi:hypothetical protein
MAVWATRPTSIVKLRSRDLEISFSANGSEILKPNHNVQPSKLLDSQVDGSPNLSLLGNISLSGEHFQVGIPLRDDFGTLLRISNVNVYKEDVRSFRCEQDR